ncbi:MAG: hypothetical protein RLZZ230_220 [Candidatus Parcubacteria bacterium]|jgi:hypothetical protein
MLKNIIIVLSLTVSLFLVSAVQADTIKTGDLSQLRSNPMAAFDATADIGTPMSAATANEMRGEYGYILATILRYVPTIYRSLYTCGVNGICMGPIIATLPKTPKSGGGSW